MAIAMLVMFAIIILLLIVIGVLLIRRQTANPLKGAEVLTADYIDETGVSSGTRAYIEIDKNSFRQVSEKQFRSFTDKVVRNDEYVMFTIVCEDGSGIVFTDQGETIRYGYIDSNGRITEEFGIVQKQNGKYVYHAH